MHGLFVQSPLLQRAKEAFLRHCILEGLHALVELETASLALMIGEHVRHLPLHRGLEHVLHPILGLLHASVGAALNLVLAFYLGDLLLKHLDFAF